MKAISADARSSSVRFAVVGALAWALATVAIRLAPLQALKLGPLEASLAIVAGLGAAAGLAVLLMRNVEPAQRVRAISAFVLPGMAGDSLTTAFCSAVFPNLPSGAAGVFGALMLAGYAAMIAAVFARGIRAG